MKGRYFANIAYYYKCYMFLALGGVISTQGACSVRLEAIHAINYVLKLSDLKADILQK